MEEGLAKIAQEGVPLAAFHPSIGLVTMNKYKSEMDPLGGMVIQPKENMGVNTVMGNDTNSKEGSA